MKSLRIEAAENGVIVSEVADPYQNPGNQIGERFVFSTIVELVEFLEGTFSQIDGFIKEDAPIWDNWYDGETWKNTR